MIQTPLDHQPLFSKRLIDKRVPNVAVPQAHAINLQNWAATIRDGSIRKFGEVRIRPDFIQKIFIEVLGYTGFGAHSEVTITHEKQIGAGSCDQALGFFSGGKAEVIAPLELKGANTANLDAIMPGRHKSPVQQVWEYAMDTPGCKFLVVSNMLEIRLYAVGHTRQIYERFDLLEVADSAAAYHKLQLLLGADNLLRGQTAALLAESALEERTITAELYKDYKRWRAQLILSRPRATTASPVNSSALRKSCLIACSSSPLLKIAGCVRDYFVSAARMALSYAPASGRPFGELNAICTCWTVVVFVVDSSKSLGCPSVVGPKP